MVPNGHLKIIWIEILLARSHHGGLYRRKASRHVGLRAIASSLFPLARSSGSFRRMGGGSSTFLAATCDCPGRAPTARGPKGMFEQDQAPKVRRIGRE